MKGEKRNKHQVKRYTCINWRKHITAKFGVLKNRTQHSIRIYLKASKAWKGFLFLLNSMQLGKFMLCSKHVSDACNHWVMWCECERKWVSRILLSILSFCVLLLQLLMSSSLRVKLKKILCAGLICKYALIPFYLALTKKMCIFILFLPKCE